MGERSLTKIVLRNVFSNWVGFAVQAATALVLTPFILRSLGQELYGAWALIGSITGYYGLLDLGFRAGLTQDPTRYLSTGEHDEMNRTASTGVFLLLTMGIVCLLLALGTALALPRFVQLPAETVRRAQIAVAIMGIGFAAQFVFFTYSALLTALQRFDIANAIGVTTRLATTVLTYVALKKGGGLVALSVIATASLLADYGLRTMASIRLVPQLRVRPSLISAASARQFVGYGVWNALVQGGVRLILYSDALVIGMVVGAAAIAPFAIAVSLVSYFSDLLVPIPQVFFPVFTRLDARGDRDELRRVYVRSSRLLLLVCGAAAALCVFMAYDFINLWVGQSVLNGNRWGSAATLFYVLAAGAVVTGWQRLSVQVLLAIQRVRTTAWLFGAEAISNLVLSIVLGRRLGIIGVAWGTAIPSLVFNLLVTPIVTCRAIDLDVWRYWRETMPRPVLAAGIAGGLLAAADSQVVMQGGWAVLFVRAAISVVVVAFIALFIGMSNDERIPSHGSRWAASSA